jgi:SecY interacting protein Syd
VSRRSIPKNSHGLSPKDSHGLSPKDGHGRSPKNGHGRSVQQALTDFISRALALVPGGVFETQYDPQWPSACQLDNGPDDDISRWRPVPQAPSIDFSGLENALGFTLHEDIRTYYSTFWSGSLEAESDEGHVSLIQLWNPEDFDRLVANLIGHSMAQTRKKQPFTVFFATTDPDSELILSIDNQSGKVLLEEPGKPPIKEVDTNLAAFLERLTPVNTRPEIY